jgi:hypothetical protein
MQTKTLLATWAVVVGVLGISSAVAPAQSVSTVGFIKVTVPVGFSLIANPLDAGDNSIGAVFLGMPAGTIIYKYGGSPPQFTLNSYEGAWDQPDQTLEPGEGAFFLNPGPDPLTITFFGEVLQGTLTNSIPEGLSIRSSLAPVAGPLDTALNFPVEDGDTVYRFRRAPNPNGYSIHGHYWGQWDSTPYIEIGEAFFVSKLAPTVWVKTFSINQ